MDFWKNIAAKFDVPNHIKTVSSKPCVFLHIFA